MNACPHGSAWCTFRVAHLLFGLDVTKVREVLRPLPLTPLPGSPVAVRGLLHLRGQMVTAIDLRTALGLPLAPCGAHVVTFGDGEPVSLLVDAIGGVQSAAGRAVEAAPKATHGGTASLAPHAVALNGELLLLMDLDRLLDAVFAPGAGVPPGGPI